MYDYSFLYMRLAGPMDGDDRFSGDILGYSSLYSYNVGCYYRRP